MNISYLSISEKFFSSEIILLVVELVLFEIQYIHDECPVVPILQRKLVAEAH